jgi:DNA-binding transcriptional MerR regulator
MTRSRLTISDVHKRTGIPVTTLRFYEKELPDFFTIEKTTGGHRRYCEESVQQFLMVKKMVDSDGMRLSTIREKFAGRGEDELRKHVDLLLAVHDTVTRELDRLIVRVESLEMAVSSLKKSLAAAQQLDTATGKKRRWF